MLSFNLLEKACKVNQFTDFCGGKIILESHGDIDRCTVSVGVPADFA
jgi:hypothetical protein